MFARKVNEICELYQNAQELYQKGIHVISTDEMTGIQALEHKYPDKLPLPGQVAKMEFEYIRHGTTSLIGFFHVATGKMETPYLNSTRTEEDFVKAVEAFVNTDPEASFLFVCDGLNIHKSESLVRFVAESCKIETELGQKGKSGILKNMETRAEFLHDTSHRIRINSRNLQPLFCKAFRLSIFKITHFFSKKCLTFQSKNAALRALN